MGTMRLALASLMWLLWMSAFVYASAAHTCDGTQSDCQTEIDTIEGEADHATSNNPATLTIGSPSTTYNWGSAVTIDAIASTFVTVQCAGSGATRATINVTHSGAGAGAFQVNTDDGSMVRITNCLFTDSGTPRATIWIGGGADSWCDLPCWIVDTFTASDIGDRFMIVGPEGGTGSVGGIGPYGLVHTCTVTDDTGGTERAFYLFFGDDSASWTTNHTWGTQQAIYVENCTFTRPDTAGDDVVPGFPIIDGCCHGLRFAFRYNTANNWYVVWHGADSVTTSTLQVEVMHNTFNLNCLNEPSMEGEGIDFAVFARGGTATMFDNDFVANFNEGEFNYCGWNFAYRLRELYFGPDEGMTTPCNTVDYPCSQQIGRGVSGGVEATVPLYIGLDDTYSLGGGGDPGAAIGTQGEIQDDRDYIDNTQRPGYTELTYPHPCAQNPGIVCTVGDGPTLNPRGGIGGIRVLDDEP